MVGFDTAGIKQAEPQCQRITRRTWAWICSVLQRNLVHTTKHVCHSLQYVVVCRYIPCGWWNVLKRNQEEYYNLILYEVCTQLLRKAFPSTICYLIGARYVFLNILSNVSSYCKKKNISDIHTRSTGWLSLEIKQYLL